MERTERTERRKAADYPQELLDLFDTYVHGAIDRRAFLEGAQRFATGTVTALALWESLRADYAWAEQIPKNDARIRTEYAAVPSPQGNGTIRGYLVRPAKTTAKTTATGKLPAVLVIHENRGLNPYIEDVARRLGAEGFLAFAPDALTSLGGYPGDDEKGGELFRKLDRAKVAEDLVASARWLRAHPEGTGKVGAVGFCFGGAMVNLLAVRLGADLAAGVPFYGGQPAAADAGKIRAPLLLHYAGLDKRVNEGWPAYEEALKAQFVPYWAFVYEAANHGFHNDTTPRYDEASAKLAWSRTLGVLSKYVRG